MAVTTINETAICCLKVIVGDIRDLLLDVGSAEWRFTHRGGIMISSFAKLSNITPTIVGFSNVLHVSNTLFSGFSALLMRRFILTAKKIKLKKIS